MTACFCWKKRCGRQWSSAAISPQGVSARSGVSLRRRAMMAALMPTVVGVSWVPGAVARRRR